MQALGCGVALLEQAQFVHIQLALDGRASLRESAESPLITARKAANLIRPQLPAALIWSCPRNSFLARFRRPILLQ